ncbi:MAG: hypothetical protein ACI8P0_000580 [Planctomycetaceae bacterium]|jgi:hypothetical protein
MTVNEALIRKEFREHRQQLIPLSAFVSGFLLLALPFGASTVLDAFYLFIALYYPALAGVFVATRIATGERTAGTLEFVKALPVPLESVARIRLFTGLLVCAAPILLATILVGVIELLTGNTAFPDDRMASGVMHGQMQSLHVGPFGAIVYTGAISTVSTILVYIWSCVASVGRQNETRAGVASVFMLALWLVVAVVTIVGFQKARLYFDWPRPLLIAVINGFGPGAGLGLSEITFNQNRGPGMVVFAHIVVVLIQAKVLRFLIGRFCRNYGHDRRPALSAGALSVRRPGIRERLAAATDKVATFNPRIRSRIGALVWKQFRETLPVGLAGAFLIVVLAVLSGFGRNVMAQGLVTVGWMVALLFGVGAFATDLQDGVREFRMSRPTRPARWFMTQFVAGFGLFVGFVYLPFFALFAFSIGVITSSRHGVVDVPTYFGSVLLMHAVTYSLAVAFCWVFRQRVHAGFFAGLASMGIILLPTLQAPDLFDLWDVAALASPRHEYFVFLSVTFGTIAVASIAACLSARFERLR